jgi:hypothetical protein
LCCFFLCWQSWLSRERLRHGDRYSNHPHKKHIYVDQIAHTHKKSKQNMQKQFASLRLLFIRGLGFRKRRARLRSGPVNQFEFALHLLCICFAFALHLLCICFAFAMHFGVSCCIWRVSLKIKCLLIASFNLLACFFLPCRMDEETMRKECGKYAVWFVR